MQSPFRGLMRCVVATVVAAGGLIVAPRAMAQGVAANTIFNDLLQRGVPFGGRFRPLPPPSLADGLNAAQQQQIIGAILKRKSSQPTYKAFTENKLNAPYVMFINALDTPFGGSDKPGHSIDLWFVAWGKLNVITAPQFLKEQFQPDKDDRIDVLKENELPMGVKPQQIPNGGDWFVNGQFMIFSNDKRVQVRGTAHAMETTNAESGTLAAVIDPRFNQNSSYPNEWRPVIRDANGRIQVGPNGKPLLGQPTPYVSAGGYLKATKLIQPNGALLVEYHLVYDEPPGWFGKSSDLLRSKLYMKAEDDVRLFRRKVLKASEEKKD